MADIEGGSTITQESNASAADVGVLVQGAAPLKQDDAGSSSGAFVSVGAVVASSEGGGSVSSSGGVLVAATVAYAQDGDESQVQDLVLNAYETINFLGTLGPVYRFLLPEYTGLPDPTGVRNIGNAVVSLTMVAQSGEKIWIPKKGGVAAAAYDYVNYTLRPGEELLFIPLATRGWLRYPGDPDGIAPAEMFEKAYWEYTYSGGDLTEINVWETASKLIKLREKRFTYTTGTLTSMTDEDLTRGVTETKTFGYSAGDLSNITKTLS
jgi:hypothetical protein